MYNLIIKLVFFIIVDIYRYGKSKDTILLKQENANR
jgi:hypothetical protein